VPCISVGIQYLNCIVEWSVGHSTPAGNRGKDETPQAKMRRLIFLPAESEGTYAQ